MNGRKTVRGLSLFLLLFLLLPILVLPANAENAPVTDGVDAVCVLNPEYGRVVYGLNANRVLYPASTAKLVTALVAEEYFSGNPDTLIEITADMKATFRGRCLGYATGERVSVDSLLHAMLVGGYNDAALALAFAVAGSSEAFARMMNDTVRALGATQTHYTNPMGLHDAAMVTSASDTALVGAAILANERLYAITKKQKYTLPATNMSGEWTIYTRNHLISSLTEEGYYYQHAAGINAGSTDEGGDCVVTSGTYDGLTYVCVVLGGRGEGKAFVAAKNALRYGLVGFSVIKLKSKKEKITTLPVLYSATVTKVPVYMKQDLTALMPVGVEADKDVSFVTDYLYESIPAPFEDGAVVGSIRAYDKSGNLLAETDLITPDGVAVHGFLLFMAKAKEFVKSKLFILLLLLFFLILAASVWLGSFLKKKRKPRRRQRFNE